MSVCNVYIKNENKLEKFYKQNDVYMDSYGDLIYKVLKENPEKESFVESMMDYNNPILFSPVKDKWMIFTLPEQYRSKYMNGWISQGEWFMESDKLFWSRNILTPMKEDMDVYEYTDVIYLIDFNDRFLYCFEYDETKWFDEQKKFIKTVKNAVSNSFNSKEELEKFFKAKLVFNK